MPYKPKRPCSYPGCPKLTASRFCEEHTKEEAKRYERYQRDPAVKKRYGRTWKRIRDRYITAHPLCEQCQKDGKLLGTDALYIETWKWLKERGYKKFVNPRLIEAYAQAFTRYIQCEEAISTYGFLGKHPTTDGAITSPFVQMSQSFQKQAHGLPELYSRLYV